MKAVLEPKEILIRIMPSKETPSGYYYIVQTKKFFRVYTTLEEVLEEIQKKLKPGQFHV